MGLSPKTFKAKKKLVKPTHKVRVTLTLSDESITPQMENPNENLAMSLIQEIPRAICENHDLSVLDIDVAVREL